MIVKPTLFILGTGASKPYGFPTGIELKNDIIRSFPVDFNQLLHFLPSASGFQKEKHLSDAKSFVENFAKSPLYSIDQYLTFNPIDSLYGKMAIAYYIRKREFESKFGEYSPPGEDWYSLLFNRMIASLKKPQDFEKFKDNRVAFITFNYDRSLEYFLHTSFLKTFSQKQDKFKETLKEYIPFQIIHVYGDVGAWDFRGEEQLDCYRGSSITFNMLEGLSKRIHVFGEKSVEDVKKKITKIVSEYTRIFFCGFGYAKENLEVIGYPKQEIVQPYKIFGTAKGMTPKEIREVKGSLFRNIPSYLADLLIIENKNTYGLLWQYL